MSTEYVPRQRRRRRSRRAPIAFLITLVVLVAILVVADRVAAAVAAGQVADKLAGRTPFTQRPDVKVHGFPFLTQAVGGKYSDIEVSGSGLQVATVGDVTVDAHLRGVHLSVSDIRGGVQEVPVDRIDVDLLVPWQDFARASNKDGLSITGSDAGVTLTQTLSVPGIGSTNVSATAAVSVTDNAVSVRVRAARAGGSDLSGSALEAVSQALSFRVPLSDLPYDARLASVRTTSAGLRVIGSVRDVVLRDLSAG